ncbi:MAG: hypothetical protein Q7K42_06610 [Candidatus Diapherotrites archaeon]|nr:hypothetical protein [Candidatus Diapherotrites archaeon]
MFVYDTLKHYLNNYKTALAFLMLLVFVFIFNFFSNVFTTSGNIFLYYSFVETTFFQTILELVTGIAFLFGLSILVTITIFGIRRDLSNIKMEYYLKEIIEKFSVKVFLVYVMYIVLAFLAVQLGQALSPGIGAGNAILFANFLILLLTLALLFVPQAIVVDEESIMNSIYNSFEFITKYPTKFILTIAVSGILVALLPIIEIIFDSFSFTGRFFSLIVTLIFIIPIIEMMKTHFYLMKYGLIEFAHKSRNIKE